MKKIILFLLFIGFIFSFSNLVLADTSNISKLVFTTEPQVVLPNAVSKYITLQIQDVSGNQVSALETIRFDAFQSTSPTGVFVSCTTPTNPPTDYLSKNGSNKNICYKDSTEGTYTITVKTNNTSNVLVATQSIVVSASSAGGEASSTTTATSTSTTTANTTTTTTNDTGSSYYVYSSSVSLSTYEPLSLNVEAGRERLGFLHTPMEFKAYSKDKKSGKNVSGARYYWTFGDGTSGDGSEIKHAYLFPGEYNVVLNSSSGDEDAVDITKVKIINPEIKIVAGDQYFELLNVSLSDINIGGWKIRGNEKEYLIPRDTIISAQRSVKIPNSVLASVLGGEKIALLYPDSQIVSEIVTATETEKKKLISELSQKLLAIQNEFYITYEKENSLSYPEGNTDIVDGKNGVDGVTSTRPEGDLVATVASAPVSKNIVSKIIDFFAIMFR